MTFFRFNILTAVFIILASCPDSSASKDTVITTAITKTKPGIQFIEEDWAQALKTAKDKEKLIFLDIYATWCGPCKMLKQYTFTDSSVGEFFNKNFINVALDMEKGDGLGVAATYQVRAYPTLIITDADGKIITYSEGYVDASQLIEFGKHGLSIKKK